MGKLSIGSFIYIVFGLLIANSQGYLATLDTFPHILSALLAVILWPLPLLGVNLHLVF